MKLVFKHIRRGAILLIGSTVLLIGALMIVLPGPGIPVLIAGFAILATEFVWAERIVDRLRKYWDETIARLKKS